MTTTPDPLDRLASVDAGTRAPALADIGSRARTLRQRRTGGRAAGVLGIAAVLAVGGVVLPASHDGRELGPAPVAQFLGVQSAEAAGSSCGQARAEWLDPGAWSRPAVATLTSTIADAPLPVTAAGAREQTDECPAPYAVAVLYDATAARGIAVYADVEFAFAPDAVLEDATVQGDPAQWRTFEGGMSAVTWVRADGTRWLARAQGVEAAELLRVLDALTLDERSVPVQDLPDGFALAVPDHAPADVVDEWWIEYGAPVPEAPASGLEPAPATLLPDAGYVRLRVTPAGEPWQVAFAGGLPVEPTTVGDVPATVSSRDDGMLRLRWTAGGCDYELVADGGTVEQLRALAERVTPVDPATLADVPVAPGAGALR